MKLLLLLSMPKQICAITVGEDKEATWILDGRSFSEWKAFIHKSTQTLYTEAEKTTGMYRYITDCFNNSPLTLSVFAYGVDFWCLDPIIRKYSDISITLTSTNWLALGNQNYWKSVGISDIQVISNAGHFLQIFSQKQTIEAILRILDIRPYDFIEFGVSYNFPIMSLPPTSIDLNCVANQ